MFSCDVEGKEEESVVLTIILLVVPSHWRSHRGGVCLSRSCLWYSFQIVPWYWRGAALPAGQHDCRSLQVSVLFYSIWKNEHQQRRMLVMFCMTRKGDWNEQIHFAECKLVLSWLLFHCFFWLMFASFKNRNEDSVVLGEPNKTYGMFNTVYMGYFNKKLYKHCNEC